MKLSTRARYGTRALVELALAWPDHTVSVSDVAQRQKISPKYLERIMSALKASGIIKAERGVHGGYALARAPESITLSEVLNVLEGSSAPVKCVDDPDLCPLEDICPVRDTWVEVKRCVEEVLARTTIGDLAKRKKRIDGAASGRGS